MSLIILLATQRSGTNMLRRVLNTHPEIVTIPEVFNDLSDNSDEMPGNLPRFKNFLLSRVEEDPRLCQPTHRPALAEDYFSLVESVIGDAKGIVDIKYNSLHHADGSWRYPSSPPRLLNILRERNYTFISLVRRDIVATVYSTFRAQHTQLYIADSEGPVDRIRFSIQPKKLLWRLQNAKKDIEIVRNWIRPPGFKVLEIFYEDFFRGAPGSSFSGTQFEQILDFAGLGSAGLELTPRTRKISPTDYRTELENFDELERALRGTEFYESFVNRG